MDDFVGPSRFQWTDRALSFARHFRETLPRDMLLNPQDRSKSLPTVEAMMRGDPTEAADSNAILPSLREIFPDVYILPTGGAIYHTGLNDVLANMDEESGELKAALLLDDALSLLGENHYAVAIAEKVDR